MSKSRFGLLSAATALSLAVLSSSALWTPVYSQSQARPVLKRCNLPEGAHTAANEPYEADQLIVMVDPKADKGQVADALRESNGTVQHTLNFEGMQFVLINTQKDKFAETEKKLAKDREHFAYVSRNYVYKSQALNPSYYPNDPKFGDEWHLWAMNVPPAWALSKGAGVTIGIVDSGCQASNPDLAGKTLEGLNLNNGGKGNVEGLAKNDAGVLVPHGTLVATTAAASSNNSLLTAAPAQASLVHPYRVIGANGHPDLFNIMMAISDACQNKVKLLNFSIAAVDTKLSLANPNVASSYLIQLFCALHHTRYNGLSFFAVGNSGPNGQKDPNPRAGVPFMYFVSAINTKFSRLKTSNYGPAVSFTAPGDQILCSDHQGKARSGVGTSFSTPLVTAAAALVWSRNPNLKNEQVISILKKSCVTTEAGDVVTDDFGYGMPDVEKAVKLAK